MTAVVYQKKGKVGYITINRPEAMNAMNSDVWSGLKESLIKIGDDDEVVVAVLSGEGDRAFSVGADLKETAAIGASSGIDMQSPFDLLSSFGGSKPVIAAINGYCLGAGFFLALACDIRITSEQSIFGIPEVTLAMCPDMGVTQWLPRLIPSGLALKLLLTGEKFSASEAYRLGLVTEVVPSHDLINAADRVAFQIGNNGPVAVKAIKTVFWRGLQHGMNEGLRLERELSLTTLESEDAKEAIKAFVEKRKPFFKGK